VVNLRGAGLVILKVELDGRGDSARVMIAVVVVVVLAKHYDMGFDAFICMHIAQNTVLITYFCFLFPYSEHYQYRSRALKVSMILFSSCSKLYQYTQPAALGAYQ
jgi:hypothetical protein